MELTELLDSYAAQPEQPLPEGAAQALSQAQVYVPASADKNLVPVQGNLMGLKPDAIPAGEGRVLFPVFSHPSKVPDEYGSRFTFLHMSLSAFAQAAAGDPRFAGIVIDPFTAKFFFSGK
jgi:hypothetical protein